jgi:hypothetical protein
METHIETHTDMDTDTVTDVEKKEARPFMDSDVIYNIGYGSKV